MNVERARNREDGNVAIQHFEVNNNSFELTDSSYIVVFCHDPCKNGTLLELALSTISSHIFKLVTVKTMNKPIQQSLIETVDDDWLFADVTENEDAQQEAGTQKDLNEQSGMDRLDEIQMDRISSLGSRTHLQVSSSNKCLATFEMPPQLHPAVSLGVRRVSSCYFSLSSQESMTDLLSQLGDSSQTDEVETRPGAALSASRETESSPDWIRNNAKDVFYHDILMNVFNFLDAQSLKNFSETARRPNFEVFYYLQLQVQQALLVEDDVDSSHDHSQNRCIHNHNHLSAVAGSAFVSRLARLDRERAHEVVNTFLESNSTLRTMPLSHSLAYARRYLLHNGFSKMFPHANEGESNHNNRALASAVLFMTVVGAASLMSTVSGGDVSAIASSLESFGTELPNVIFRVGFVGSLMGAARQMSDTEQRAAMRETAEQMTRSMKELPSSLMRGAASDGEDATPGKTLTQSQFRLPSLFEMKEQLQITLSKLAAEEHEKSGLLSNPYDHLPAQLEHTTGDEKKEPEESIDASRTDTTRKMPSGCVGAYARAIDTSSQLVKQLVKDNRKNKFETKSEEERRLLSLEFLNACASNDTLSRVKEMIHQMDVDGFFVGNDGSETCALHTAAFHGADHVVKFLCSGVDENDSHLDGGLCDINARDNNGWTAMHFAAGANAPSVVRVLAFHGAELQVEAQNGYSPLQWAVRLSNDDVAQALTELIANADNGQGTWMSRQPLTFLANRFFSLIPTH